MDSSRTISSMEKANSPTLMAATMWVRLNKDSSTDMGSSYGLIKVNIEATIIEASGREMASFSTPKTLAYQRVSGDMGFSTVRESILTTAKNRPNASGTMEK